MGSNNISPVITHWEAVNFPLATGGCEIGVNAMIIEVITPTLLWWEINRLWPGEGCMFQWTGSLSAHFACRLVSTKSLIKPVLDKYWSSLQTHMHVTRPRWVDTCPRTIQNMLQVIAKNSAGDLKMMHWTLIKNSEFWSHYIIDGQTQPYFEFCYKDCFLYSNFYNIKSRLKFDEPVTRSNHMLRKPQQRKTT